MDGHVALKIISKIGVDAVLESPHVHVLEFQSHSHIRNLIYQGLFSTKHFHFGMCMCHQDIQQQNAKGRCCRLKGPYSRHI